MSAKGSGEVPWVSLWKFDPLPKFGKVALIAIVAVAAVASVLITTTTDPALLTVLFEVATIGMVALFTWRPPVAAIAMLASTAAAMYLDQSSAYALALAGIVGLVIYTCTKWVAIGFCTGVALWIVYAELVLQDLQTGGSIATATIGLVSGLIGFSIRASHMRQQVLEADYAQAVQSERDRITDELHNIIAHDLTTVSMHSQALVLASDESDQKMMIQAITRSADQALTDIRRMLNIVQDRGPKDHDWTHPVRSAKEALQEIETELKSLDIEVELIITYQDEVSPTVNTTLVHVAKECATNIMKHAPSTPKVCIWLTSEDQGVSLTFWNQMRGGATGSRAKGSCGLKRMTERVELLGGSLSIEKDQTGWQVRTLLPTS